MMDADERNALRASAFRNVFATNEGHLVLSHLVTFAKLAATDGLDVGVQAGRSDVVLEILDQVKRAKEGGNDG